MGRSNIVVVFNGLGNQMSQYAFYLAKKLHASEVDYLCLDTDHNGYELERIFNIKRRQSKLDLFCLRVLISQRRDFLAAMLKRILNNIGIRLKKEDFRYEYEQSNLLPTSFYKTIWHGGWHNFRYFECIKEQIKIVFTFPAEKLNKYSLSVLSILQRSNSVAVHIRRGDYLKDSNKSLFGNICTSAYYSSAINYMKQNVDHPIFFIFSNDVKWAQDNLGLSEAIYVKENENKDSWMDMYLMSQCEHLIIANSTFSWWGAYLSRAKNVICPTKFINDRCSGEIYPDNWIRIDS